MKTKIFAHKHTLKISSTGYNHYGVSCDCGFKIKGYTLKQAKALKECIEKAQEDTKEPR